MKLPEFWVVGARVTFPYRAGLVEIPGKGVFRDKFAPGAFDSSVGKTVPLRVAGRQVGWGRVVAADVAPDGASVMFTYEITELGPSARSGSGDSNDTQ